MGEIDVLTDREAAFLAEPGDLDRQERIRILAAVRSLDREDYLDLLGVSALSPKDELKRAHDQLLMEWHPDRFGYRDLGSFGPMLERIFETGSETLRTLAARTVGPVGPRRRTSNRYAFPLRMTARCESWRAPLTVVAQDLSATGMFLVTTARAQRGERIEITIPTRRSGEIHLVGRVVACRVSEAARRTERRPGVGVELLPLEDEIAERYARVVEAARLTAPMPAVEVRSERSAGRSRLARGTGSHDRATAIVGIDIGTSNVSVSAAVGNRVLVLPWSDGARCVPATVAYPSRDEVCVGPAAIAASSADLSYTVSGVKRLLGRLITDRTVDEMLRRAAYRAAPSSDGGVAIDVWGRPHSPEEIAAALLRGAADNAERHLELPVDRAVVTVPINFTADRVDALTRAAHLAGIEIMELIDEPTAVALAYQSRQAVDGVIAVFDLGGGTFDVSIVDASSGDMRVLGAAGDASLGGEDLDRVIAETAANQVGHSHGADLRANLQGWHRLLAAAEQAKKTLSSSEAASLLLAGALPGDGKSKDLRIRVTRATCEQLWSPIAGRVLEIADRAMRRARVGRGAISAVALAGGASRIPALKRAIEAHFEIPITVDAAPELVTCLGAGVRAAQIDRCLTARSTQG